MAGLWSRLTGRESTPEKVLQDNLKQITNSSTLVVSSDIPADALTSVVEASQKEDHRQAIMQHLRDCFTESSGKQWRRPYSGLLLLEVLLKRGSPELVAETAEGRHFDLVQRLAFLEQSEYIDKRVQSMLRTKAGSLRKELIPLLENADLKDRELAQGSTLETSSTGTPGSVPGSSGASAAGFGSEGESTKETSGSCKKMVGFGSDDVASETFKDDSSEVAKKMVLNNIVTIGHRDDTSSESEGEARKNRAVREAKRMSSRARNEKSQQCQALAVEAEKGATTSVAQTMNLLDF